MNEKEAFGLGLRRLRLIQGIPQQVFLPVVSLSYASVVERGKKLAALDTIGGMAAVLGLHPLTLVAAMYTEMEDVGFDDLIEGLQNDVTRLASLPLSEGVGKDARNRAEDVADAVQWLKKRGKLKKTSATKAPAKKPGARSSSKKQGASDVEDATPAEPSKGTLGTV